VKLICRKKYAHVPLDFSSSLTYFVFVQLAAAEHELKITRDTVETLRRENARLRSESSAEIELKRQANMVKRAVESVRHFLAHSSIQTSIITFFFSQNRTW
jgi:hypothetical protein